MYLTKEQIRLAQRQRELREAQMALYWARLTGNRIRMRVWEDVVLTRLARCWSYQVDADTVSRRRLPQNIFLPAVNAP